ncbi:MAG: MFS transporter [Mycobacterium sp.]
MARAQSAEPVSSALQRRTVTILFASQLLSGAGLAAGVTVGALLAQDMLDSTALSGLPSALFTAGSAFAALAVGRVSNRYGRRPGLAAGYVAAMLGSLGVVLGAALDNMPLLFVALTLYGAGTATNLQARYAGADLAEPAHRGRAVSIVLVATTFGGVIGPNLATPTGNLATALGIPHLAGLFLLSAAAYGTAAVVLTIWLRPDPLLHARELHAESTLTDAGYEAGTDERTDRGGVMIGATVMVLAQLIMVAIMTMTPVQIHAHGHSTTAAGAVIAGHIAAMYLPSPLTGILVDRYGRRIVAVASGLVLLFAGLLAATAPTDSVVVLALALALLGLGWNLGLVAGTAMVTDAVAVPTRAKTQGAVDVSIAIAGAVGGMGSGLVVAGAGYPVLGIAGGVLALAIIPLMARRPRNAAP